MAYRDIILADKPVGYWPGDIDAKTGELVDIVGGRNGILKGVSSPEIVSGIGGRSAVRLDPTLRQFINVANDSRWSLNASAGLTVEAWFKLDAVDFEDACGKPVDYIHWLGKGVDDQQEWSFRLYSFHNCASRSSRLSFYVFNQDGGEGAGAYSQYDETKSTVHIVKGQWMHVAGTLTPYHGWPNPPNTDFKHEGPTIFHNGKIRNGVAKGNSADSYFGTLPLLTRYTRAPITFPLRKGISVEIDNVSDLHLPHSKPQFDLRVVIMDDNGQNHVVRYSSVLKTNNSLVGCESEDGVAGTAAVGRAVQQGHWQISPKHGQADLRFGTRDEAAYLPGSLSQIAIYNHVLDPRHIDHHYSAGQSR